MIDLRVTLSCLVAVLVVQPVSAADRPLIWEPSKISDTAYQARLGLNMPTATAASAGMEVGVTSATRGGPAEVPIRVWGHVTAQSVRTPANETRRNFDFRYDALSHGTTASMAYRDKEILTDAIDLEVRRNVTMRYDWASAGWVGITVDQAVRWSAPLSGTALTAELRTTDNLNGITGGIAIEQQLGSAVKISGRLDQVDGADLTGRINARYSMTW